MTVEPIAWTPPPFSVPIWPASAIVARRPVAALTAREREIVEIIRRFRWAHAYGPTFRDIYAQIEGRNWRGMEQRIYGLIRRGVLTQDRGISRSLRLAA